MDISPKEICKLAPNKVDYLIPGGEMINEFLEEGPEAKVCSQMWVASLVTSALCPGTNVGSVSYTHLHISAERGEEWRPAAG